MFVIGFSALLVSCVPFHSSLAPSILTLNPSPTDIIIPSLTYTPIETIPSLTSTSEIPTATSTPACDPTLNFCISDGHFFFHRPIFLPYRMTAEMSYLFGETEDGHLEPHHGIDLPNATGTPVAAVADGTVVFADSDRKNLVGPYTDFYGNVIVIQHSLDGIGQPVYSLYGHLSEIGVAAGQAVQAGEEIGKVGLTGIAMGSHLHFEVRLGENTYDASSNPYLWLIPLDGTGVIAGRVVDEQGNLLHLTNIKIQYFASDTSHPSSTLTVETYGPEKDHVISDPSLQENFAVGDLTAGKYRIGVDADYQLYQRWVDVDAGKLTYVEIVVK